MTLLGDIYRIDVDIHRSNTPKFATCVVTYVGATGFTLQDSAGNFYPRTFQDDQSPYLVSRALNPTTNLPYTESELRMAFPEYFI